LESGLKPLGLKSEEAMKILLQNRVERKKKKEAEAAKTSSPQDKTGPSGSKATKSPFDISL
jgi:hypothetical protein